VKIEEMIEKANYLHRIYKNEELVELANKNQRRLAKECENKGNRLLKFVKKLF
jgi:hypothetical protein